MSVQPRNSAAAFMPTPVGTSDAPASEPAARAAATGLLGARSVERPLRLAQTAGGAGWALVQRLGNAIERAQAAPRQQPPMVSSNMRFQHLTSAAQRWMEALFADASSQTTLPEIALDLTERVQVTGSALTAVEDAVHRHGHAFESLNDDQRALAREIVRNALLSLHLPAGHGWRLNGAEFAQLLQATPAYVRSARPEPPQATAPSVTSTVRLPERFSATVFDIDARVVGHGAQRMLDLRGLDLRRYVGPHGETLAQSIDRLRSQPTNAVRHIDLRDANLSGLNLDNAKLQDARLNDANLRGASLRGANLAGADAENADLTGAKLNRADLRDAFLLQATLDGADLSRAVLVDADFSETSLADAVLTGVSAARAEFSAANAVRADFSDADLDAALFIETNIDGADFTGSRHLGAVWMDTDIDSAIGLRIAGQTLDDPLPEVRQGRISARELLGRLGMHQPSATQVDAVLMAIGMRAQQDELNFTLLGQVHEDLRDETPQQARAVMRERLASPAAYARHLETLPNEAFEDIVACGLRAQVQHRHLAAESYNDGLLDSLQWEKLDEQTDPMQRAAMTYLALQRWAQELRAQWHERAQSPDSDTVRADVRPGVVYLDRIAQIDDSTPRGQRASLDLLSWRAGDGLPVAPQMQVQRQILQTEAVVLQLVNQANSLLASAALEGRPPDVEGLRETLRLIGQMLGQHGALRLLDLSDPAYSQKSREAVQMLDTAAQRIRQALQ